MADKILPRICCLDGCQNPVTARGWCNVHYRRWIKHGDPNYVAIHVKKRCSVNGCSNYALARGWCSKHWSRWRSTGNPEGFKRKGRWSKSEIDILVEKYSDVPNEELVKQHFPNRNIRSLQMKAQTLGLRKTKEAKVAALREMYDRLAARNTGVLLAERVHMECRICGTGFTKTKNYVANGYESFCSKKCADKAKTLVTGEDHPLYSLVDRKCKFCKTVFKAKPAKVKCGEAVFCGKPCAGSYSIRQQGGRISTLEVAVEKTLKKLGMDYIPQKRIGRFLCDFYLPNMNTVIECDGEYWHSLPKVIERDKRKNKEIARRGMVMIRLTESAIREDCDAAVTSAIEKAA